MVCAPITELGPPFFWIAPSNTVWVCPATTTFARTGEGGNPPPVKVDDWSPPQLPVTPMAPEPLNIFTIYPRASPSSVVHVPATAGIGRLVLQLTPPPAMMADVTVCSPTPC